MTSRLVGSHHGVIETFEIALGTLLLHHLLLLKTTLVFNPRTHSGGLVHLFIFMSVDLLDISHIEFVFFNLPFGCYTFYSGSH